jgi:hypothetical protein
MAGKAGRSGRKPNSATKNANSGNAGGNNGAENTGAESKDDLGPPLTLDPTTFTGGFTDPVSGPQTPESNTEPSTGETVQRRGPGRPRGTGARPKINASGVEKLLLGIHHTLRTVTGVEELDMNEHEARELASAYADVSEYYPIMNFDPKYAALANFVGVVSLVYGTKLMALKMRHSMNKIPRRASPITPAQQPMQNPVNAQSTQTQPPVNEFNGQEVPAPEPAKGPLPPELRKAHIAGVGDIVFDENHPLVTGRKQ